MGENDFVHFGIGMANWEAYSQLFGLGMGMLN